MGAEAFAAAIVPAAGSGVRLGAGSPKSFVPLRGEPILLHTLRVLRAHPWIRSIVVALPAAAAAAPPRWLTELGPELRTVAGGAERRDSVERALAAVPEEAEIVLVHDGARPLVTRPILDRVLQAAARGVGAVAAIPMADTVKQVDPDRRVVATPDRGGLWRAQTPQAFPAAMIREAYRAAPRDVAATDDAALVERIGGVVEVVDGSVENLKITRPADLELAEVILARRAREVGA